MEYRAAPMRPPGHLPSLLLAAAITLAGCSQGADGDTLAQVQDDLEAQAESQQSLRSRIDDLEQTLGGLQGGEGEAAEQVSSLREQLSSIQEQLASLEESVPALRERLDADEVALEDVAAELRAGVATLDERLGGVESSLEELRSLAQRTGEDLALLEQRFEAHLRNHG